MSGKYSENRFFLAHYGCCIPTESYAWILVVLFITTILVLLFCMLSTATIRWMYKRRMRKRLQDLKRKFQQDQLKAQEFEAKLSFMAQKNKNNKPVPINDSKEGKMDKLTILVDPAQNKAPGTPVNPIKVVNDTGPNPTNKQQIVPTPAVYDADDTPIAQSTLASKSKTKAPYENKWFMPPQQKTPIRPLMRESPISSPGLWTPVASVMSPLKRDSTRKAPTEASTQTIPESVASSLVKVPIKRNSKELAQPSTISTSGTSDFTTAGTTPMTTAPITTIVTTIPTTPSTGSPFATTAATSVTTTPPTDMTGTTGIAGTTGGSGMTATTGATGAIGAYGAPVAIGTSGTAGVAGIADSTGTTTNPTAVSGPPLLPSTVSNYSSNAPVQSAVPVSLSDEKEGSSNGDDVKANIQYGQEDIVSPRQSDKTEDRKEGAGGRNEWKYYYMNTSASDGIRHQSSSVTKSSASYRPSSRSWLFDSTGSSRFDVAKEGSSTSSSIIKTDSTHYKTASVKSFPHGAFAFEQ